MWNGVNAFRKRYLIEATGTGISIPYTGPDDPDATERERRVPVGRLTWFDVTGADGRRVVGTFYAHENLPDRLTAFREAIDPDRRPRQANPSAVGRAAIEAAVEQGNARVGLSTHNHCRPACFATQPDLDWTHTVQPRFLKPGSAPEARRQALAEAAWAAPSAATEGVAKVVRRGRKVVIKFDLN